MYTWLTVYMCLSNFHGGLMVGLWLADIRENLLVFFCLMVPRPESPEWFSVVVPDLIKWSFHPSILCGMSES